MWGLNKNTPFVLVPKDLISTIDLYDLCKWGYIQISLVMIYEI